MEEKFKTWIVTDTITIFQISLVRKTMCSMFQEFGKQTGDGFFRISVNIVSSGTHTLHTTTSVINPISSSNQITHQILPII